jgi:transcription elongation GreA/GreB family factor
LYKYSRDAKDELSDRIAKVETALAVNSAIDPWRSKVLQMQIGEVVDLVNLEAERRCCADNSIVTYANATFYPKSVADVTTGTTTTQMEIFNPIPNCGCKCNFNPRF